LDTVVKKLYEGLFLVDSSQAASDWDGVTASIEKALSRADADVVEMKKWDERRLAYDVKGKSRGTYILAYFNCDPLKISGIERDVTLSESIARVLILRTDKMNKDDLEKEVPFVIAERRAAEEAVAAQAAAEARQVAAEARKVAVEARQAAAKAEAAKAEEAKEKPQEDTVAEEASEEDKAVEEI
jgi:small subunit ribosomal protein S6